MEILKIDSKALNGNSGILSDANRLLENVEKKLDRKTRIVKMDMSSMTFISISSIKQIIAFFKRKRVFLEVISDDSVKQQFKLEHDNKKNSVKKPVNNESIDKFFKEVGI